MYIRTENKVRGKRGGGEIKELDLKKNVIPNNDKTRDNMTK